MSREGSCCWPRAAATSRTTTSLGLHRHPPRGRESVL